jgi:hypothetical protein
VASGATSAAVPHPDGSHRRLYCVENPESWFEDSGTGQLECGGGGVPLDPDFAAVVHVDDSHVFLTAYDPLELHVNERTAACRRCRVCPIARLEKTMRVRGH